MVVKGLRKWQASVFIQLNESPSSTFRLRIFCIFGSVAGLGLRNHMKTQLGVLLLWVSTHSPVEFQGFYLGLLLPKHKTALSLPPKSRFVWTFFCPQT